MEDSFKHTRRAIIQYVSTIPVREQACASAADQRDVNDCMGDEALAKLEICWAFYTDTAHVNSWERCQIMTAEDVGRMVDAWDMCNGGGEC